MTAGSGATIGTPHACITYLIVVCAQVGLSSLVCRVLFCECVRPCCLAAPCLPLPVVRVGRLSRRFFDGDRDRTASSSSCTRQASSNQRAAHSGDDPTTRHPHHKADGHTTVKKRTIARHTPSPSTPPRPPLVVVMSSQVCRASRRSRGAGPARNTRLIAAHTCLFHTCTLFFLRAPSHRLRNRPSLPSRSRRQQAQ